MNLKNYKIMETTAEQEFDTIKHVLDKYRDQFIDASMMCSETKNAVMIQLVNLVARESGVFLNDFFGVMRLVNKYFNLKKC